MTNKPYTIKIHENFTSLTFEIQVIDTDERGMSRVQNATIQHEFLTVTPLKSQQDLLEYLKFFLDTGMSLADVVYLLSQGKTKIPTSEESQVDAVFNALKANILAGKLEGKKEKVHGK